MTLSESAARERFGGARVATLATADAAGVPHLVPFTFAVAGDLVFHAVDHKPKRSANLRRIHNIRENSRVSALVDHYDEDWSALWWVRLRGRARVVERGDELADAVVALQARYEQYRDRPPGGPAIVVAIEDWSNWSSVP